MFTTTEGFRSMLVAVPIGTGASASATKLLDFVGAWDLSADGRVLAVIVPTTSGARVATWDVRAGGASWVGSPDPALALAGPIWSKDGAHLYYAQYAAVGAATDYKATLVRITSDGRSKLDIATLDRFGALVRLTPDGGGLIWSRAQAGGSVEVLDLATGVNRHLDDVAGVASIRLAQPRMLLTVGGCCAGRPGGSLVLWDDAAMTSRVVAERSPGGAVAWGGAAWDPSGARIVATQFDAAHQYDGQLVTVDPVSGAFAPIPNTGGAYPLAWLSEGIVFAARATDANAPVELKLLSSLSGAAETLYRGSLMYRVVVVRS
jgi:hypothetical protein